MSRISAVREASLMQVSQHQLEEEQIDAFRPQQGGSPPDDYEQRIRQLERQLQVVSKERDELERDVEQLCMSRGSNMFSSSYVLSQRLQFLEAEVKQQRLDLRNITTERDSLLEDILQIRSSKRETDQGWQQEKQRSADLERQLSFFQAQSAQAIADRDRACYEAKHTKTELQAAAAALQEVRAQLSAQEQHTKDVQQQLAAARQQVQGSQEDLVMARGQLKQLPVVQQQLQQQTAMADGLQAELLRSQTRCELSQSELTNVKEQLLQSQTDVIVLQQQLTALQQDVAASKERLQQSVTDGTALQQEVLTLQQELAAAAATSKEQNRDLREANALLHKQLNQANLKVTDLQRLLEQTSAALVSSQAAVKELHAAAKGRSKTGGSATPQEVVKLKAVLAEADESLQQAAQDKLDLMEQLSQAQAAEDELLHTIQLLETRNNQLKVLLAQATQEKVQALLQVAANAGESSNSDVSATDQNSTPAAEVADEVVEQTPENGNAAAQQERDTTDAQASATAAAMALNAGAPKRTPAADSRCITPPPSPASSAFVFPGANAAAAAAAAAAGGGAAGHVHLQPGSRCTSSSNACGTPPPSPAAWNHSAAEGAPAAAAAAGHSTGHSSSSTVQGPPTPGRLAAAVAAVAAHDPQEQECRADAGTVAPGEAAHTALSSIATTHQASRSNSSSGSSGVATNATALTNSSSSSSSGGSAAAPASTHSSSQPSSRLDSTTWQAEREQLLQQLWLRMHQSERLVTFASHCRLVLQDLQPGALAAAAADSQRGRRGAQDPMIRLKALADELEASRKLLLGSRSSQQQHDAAMATLQAASTMSPASTIEHLMGSHPAAYDTGSSTKSMHAAPQKQQQQGAPTGWKLWSGSSSGSSKPLAVTSMPGPGVQQMLAASSSSSSGSRNSGSRNSTSKQVATGSRQLGALAASSSSSSRMMIDASDMLWSSQLDVAMACEVQLLCDMCVAALRHIHKVTALSTLMQDFW